MKVCDLTQSYAATGGGVRTYLHAKRDHLIGRTRHEHVLIVPGPEDRREVAGRASTYRVAGPRVPGSPAYRLLLRSDKVLRILEHERPDVIEVHCLYNLPWTALRHRRRHPCAVVGFFMTDVGAAYVEPGVRRVLGRRAGGAARRVADAYTRALYARCDATVAISAGMARDLLSRGVPNAHCIPLGVDLDRFRPGPDENGFRRRFGAGPDDLLLVYAGRLDVERRPSALIDALQRLPSTFPAVLVLAGEGPLRGELEAAARSDRRIHVIPFVQDRDGLAALLRAADLYVSAMPHETFGLSVVEAQACGLPVLGVRAGAMVERVAEGETGILVPPDDPAAMAAAVERLARDPDRRRAMGRAARAHVEERFSWHRTFRELLALYDTVLTEPAARDHDGATASGGAPAHR